MSERKSGAQGEGSGSLADSVPATERASDPLRPSLMRRVVEGCLRYPYVWWIRPHVRTEIGRQRLRLLLFGWGYLRLLGTGGFPLKVRFQLIRRFLTVDWNVLHSHRQEEIASICRVLA